MQQVKEMQFAKRSLLLIAGSMVKIAVQLLILYIFSRQLNYIDYGKYQSLWLYLNVLSVIGLFGLPAILLSSSYSTITNWIKQNIAGFSLLAFLFNIIPLAFVVVASVDFSIKERILICLLILSQSIAIVVETFAIKNEKELKVLIINLIYHAAFLFLHLLIIQQQPFSLSYLMMGLIAINIIKSISIATKPQFKHEVFVPGNNLGKQWIYLGLNDMASVLFKWIDKWLILVFISLEQFAFYYNGSYEIPVFGVLLSAVGNIMLVELSKLSISKSTDIVSLFHRSAYFLAAFIMPAFALLFWFNEEIFIFIFSEKYAAAIPVFLVCIFVIPVRITNYTAALQAHHRSDIILKGALLDLMLAGILMAVLYPLFKLPGLAAAFVISTYLQAFYYLWQTGKLLRLPALSLLPLKSITVILFICILIIGGVYFLVNTFINPIPLISGIIASALLVVGLLYRFYKTKRF